MIPGLDGVIFCPSCAAPARVATLVSGNTFGAIVWTDGYQFAPMLPAPPLLVQCAACKKCYWLERAPEGGLLPPSHAPRTADQAAWADAPMVEPASEPVICAALREGLATNKDEEFQARTFAWWRRNDDWRRHETAVPPAMNTETIFNLERLLILHQGHGLHSQLARSEILRSLGRIAEAQAELQSIIVENDPGLAGIKAQFESLCAAGDTRVRVIDFDFLKNQPGKR